jgi:hypothetical protein
MGPFSTDAMGVIPSSSKNLSNRSLAQSGSSVQEETPTINGYHPYAALDSVQKICCGHFPASRLCLSQPISCCLFHLTKMVIPCRAKIVRTFQASKDIHLSRNNHHAPILCRIARQETSRTICELRIVLGPPCCRWLQKRLNKLTVK